jgi:hypothetical protein
MFLVHDSSAISDNLRTEQYDSCCKLVMVLVFTFTVIGIFVNISIVAVCFPASGGRGAAVDCQSQSWT